MIRILRLFLFLFILPLCARPQTTNDALARATAAMEAAAPRAEADPARPIFHVISPAQWMNDPNGPIFYKGYYHLFYQLHPFSDGDGPKYWGHVRSRDLVKWEPLPIALAPSEAEGEAGVWSGCCTINGRGEPMIFYTSVIQGKSAFDTSSQWAAIGDDDLIHWKKSPLNPVLSEQLHGGKKIYDWRDPFIFRDGKKTFLVAGGHLEKQGGAAVNIYEAQNAELTKWTYRGVLFQLPDPKTPTAECPNFFKLGDQWVLFVSPYGHVQYFVGDFDAATCRFQPRTQGTLDYGSFYAPNTMQVPDGRRLVWGWVNGFPGGHGWNGCLSLPRLLALSRDGQLLQDPAPQLDKLRGKLAGWKNLRLENDGAILPLPKTNTLEILAEFDLRTAKRIALTVRGQSQGAQPILISFDGSELTVMDAKAPLQMAKDGGKLNLRIFIDRSVLEVFANETACITKVISPLDADPVLELRADGGPATAKRVRAWPMKTIW
jgi:beta-fructofuranosidase